MEHDQAERNIEQAIVDLEHSADGGGMILTGWVMVAEFIDKEGHPHLSAYAARGMPFWRIDGLIEAAPQAIVYTEDVDEE
jgi:hypothetical protein